MNGIHNTNAYYTSEKVPELYSVQGSTLVLERNL